MTWFDDLSGTAKKINTKRGCSSKTYVSHSIRTRLIWKKELGDVFPSSQAIFRLVLCCCETMLQYEKTGSFASGKYLFNETTSGPSLQPAVFNWMKNAFTSFAIAMSMLLLQMLLLLLWLPSKRCFPTAGTSIPQSRTFSGDQPLPQLWTHGLKSVTRQLIQRTTF